MWTDWRRTKLGDFIELKRGYDLPSQARSPGPFPVVSSAGISDNHAEYKVRGPGVVAGRYGTIGAVHFVPGDYWPLNTTLYVRDFKGADPRFVYYFLKALDWTKFSDKSGVPGVNRNDVHAEVVFVPCAPEQRAIGATLGTLDDKIELNRRMNETLEAMAQAIFRDWFVDFGPVRRKLAGERDPVAIMGGLTPDLARAAKTAAFFPDTLDERDAPAGWVARTIGDLADAVGGSTPSTADESLWQPPIYAWATPKDLSAMSDLALFDTRRRISDKGLKAISSGLLPRGTVLLSSRAPIGYLAIAQVPVAVNQGFIALKPNDDVGSAFLYAWCKANLPAIIANANGSTFQEISKRNFRPIPVLAPPTPDLLKAFDEIAGPLFERIASAAGENRTLSETRDYLLPRLMSGNLRVADAGEAAEAAA